jgi:hypothetical protein
MKTKFVDFFVSNFWRSFAVFGYSFFGLFATTQDMKLCLTASLIAGGGYFFTELMRFYKIDPTTIKKRNFTFLIFP